MAAHNSNRLSALFIKKISEPGKYGDGYGLYLVVAKSGAKRWEQRITINGKRHDLGLGSTSLISLEEVREIAIRNKRMIKNGGNPLKEKRAQQAKDKSLKEIALIVHKMNAKTYKNEKYAAQWLSSLENHVFPKIGQKSVSSINSADILSVLSPIWVDKPDTAKKIKQRLSQIMTWAKAEGYHSSDNPVDLATLALPKVSAQGRHHEALPYQEAPELIKQLYESQIKPSTRLALAFLLLTATRQSETLGARWDEIDLEKQCWVIPKERMKASLEHKVPLSKQALAVLLEAGERYGSQGIVFPNPVTGKRLSDNTLRLSLQKRLKLKTTTHGLRSTFKDWVSETTRYDNETSEMALAHIVSNKVEAAYRRGNLYEKRLSLMNDWANFLYRREEKVIRLVEGHNR